MRGLDPTARTMMRPIHPPACEIVPTVRKSPFGAPRASDVLSTQRLILNPCYALLRQ